MRVAEGMSDFRHLRLGWNRKSDLISRVGGIELGHFLLGHCFGGTSIRPRSGLRERYYGRGSSFGKGCGREKLTFRTLLGRSERQLPDQSGFGVRFFSQRWWVWSWKKVLWGSQLTHCPRVWWSAVVQVPSLLGNPLLDLRFSLVGLECIWCFVMVRAVRM